MEDIDGGLHPAVDGQSLDEDEWSHLQHTYAVPQILKACPIYLSHFPNILAISQISKSFLN